MPALPDVRLPTMASLNLAPTTTQWALQALATGLSAFLLLAVLPFFLQTVKVARNEYFRLADRVFAVAFVADMALGALALHSAANPPTYLGSFSAYLLPSPPHSALLTALRYTGLALGLSILLLQVLTHGGGGAGSVGWRARAPLFALDTAALLLTCAVFARARVEGALGPHAPAYLAAASHAAALVLALAPLLGALAASGRALGAGAAPPPSPLFSAAQAATAAAWALYALSQSTSSAAYLRSAALWANLGVVALALAPLWAARAAALRSGARPLSPAAAADRHGLRSATRKQQAEESAGEASGEDAGHAAGTTTSSRHRA